MSLQALQALAANLCELDWVQGPGGNLSVKVGDTLHVKASGVRLRDMASPLAVCAVPLQVAEAALAGDAAAGIDLFARTPRPSLETWLHALPGRYVVHTHPVGVLALACTAAALPAGTVDVAPALPGRELALVMQQAPAAVWVLRNHGLCVRAETAAKAEALTRTIDADCRRRAGIAPGAGPTPPTVTARALGGAVIGQWRAPRLPPTYLFPDAAVLNRLDLVADLTDARIVQAFAEDPRPRLLVDPDGHYAAIARTSQQLRDMTEVFTVHAWLHSLLGSDAVPLADDLVAHILDMPAERYRQLRESP